MNSDVAPLEKLLTIRKPGVSCTAIGDGGTELGMGKVSELSERALMKTSIQATTKLTLSTQFVFAPSFAGRRRRFTTES